MSGDRRVTVSVIGLGVGMRHADRYATLADARLAAVCDRVEPLAADVAARYGCAASTDAERMLDEHRPDAVSICTPPATHAGLTEAAASRGIHVLVEKPMAPTPADCERLDNPGLLRWAPRGAEGAGDVREEQWPDADPFRSELEDFLDCVRNNRPPRAGGAEAKQAVEFCLAVKESALTGRTVAFAGESGACEPAGIR